MGQLVARAVRAAREHNLQPRDLLVLITLANDAEGHRKIHGPEGATGIFVKCSSADLSYDLDRSGATISRALETLRRFKLVENVRPGTRRYPHASTYRLNI